MLYVHQRTGGVRLALEAVALPSVQPTRPPCAGAYGALCKTLKLVSQHAFLLPCARVILDVIVLHVLLCAKAMLDVG